MVTLAQCKQVGNVNAANFVKMLDSVDLASLMKFEWSGALHLLRGMHRTAVRLVSPGSKKPPHGLSQG